MVSGTSTSIARTSGGQGSSRPARYSAGGNPPPLTDEEKRQRDLEEARKLSTELVRRNTIKTLQYVKGAGDGSFDSLALQWAKEEGVAGYLVDPNRVYTLGIQDGKRLVRFS